MVDDRPAMCLIDVGTPGQMPAATTDYRSQGHKLFQHKIGEGSPRDEIARITALMADKGDDEIVWFDPNRV